jgi:hypothetical protein
MWRVQFLLTETPTQAALVLKEIVWPPNLEDRSALRGLAVTDEKWTAVADAVRVLDDVGEERLRYTHFDFKNEGR